VFHYKKLAIWISFVKKPYAFISFFLENNEEKKIRELIFFNTFDLFQAFKFIIKSTHKYAIKYTYYCIKIAPKDYL